VVQDLVPGGQRLAASPAIFQHGQGFADAWAGMRGDRSFAPIAIFSFAPGVGHIRPLTKSCAGKVQ